MELETLPMLLLAQTDPISGGGGWLGAGLLGLVLSWLCLVHLPTKDRREDEKDKRNQERMDKKDAQLTEMMREFRAALDAVIVHCNAETERIRQDHEDRDEGK